MPRTSEELLAGARLRQHREQTMLYCVRVSLQAPHDQIALCPRRPNHISQANKVLRRVRAFLPPRVEPDYQDWIALKHLELLLMFRTLILRIELRYLILVPSNHKPPS